MTFDQTDFPLTMEFPIGRMNGHCKRYPCENMAVGHSFFAPTRRVNTAYWTKLTGFKFRCVTRIENGVKGIRVWRYE